MLLAGGAALARDGEIAAKAGRSTFLARVLDESGCTTAEDVARAAIHGDAVDQRFLRESLATWIEVREPSGMPEVVLAATG